MGLFSEWLVFDYKQKIFDDNTGLEYFVKHNPLGLSIDELEAYKDLLQFEVGLFEVKSVELGKGIILESVQNKKQYFVHDVSSSLSLKPADTVWNRIAALNGLYHEVGSLSVVMPIKIMDGMREAMIRWGKNYFNAREIVPWLRGSEQEKKYPDKFVNSEHKKRLLVYEESKQNFIEALRACDMGTFFSIDTYVNWLTNERKYQRDFVGRALLNLIPEEAKDKDVSALFEAAGSFTNNVPRRSLSWKTPNETIFDHRADNDRVWEIVINTKEKYTKRKEDRRRVVGRDENYRKEEICADRIS